MICCLHSKKSYLAASSLRAEEILPQVEPDPTHLYPAIQIGSAPRSVSAGICKEQQLQIWEDDTQALIEPVCGLQIDIRMNIIHDIFGLVTGFILYTS